MASRSRLLSFPSPEKLLDRDKLLTEEARQLPRGSYRRRSEIEHELVKIRHMLKRLGHERLARLREREIVLEAVAHDLPPGRRRDDVLTEVEQLRSLIKSLKPGISVSFR
jgi:hypothetical protein